MINIGPTIPISNSDKVVTKKVAAGNAVTTVKPSADKHKRTDLPMQDRRKNKDRRHSDGKDHPLESRAGRDRRKNAESDRPSIDIKA